VVPDEPRDGLNAALRHGAAHAAARWPGSAGHCGRPRRGRRPSWPTQPVTARRCTPRRPGCRSGPRSAWRPGPGTRPAGPPSLTLTAYRDCAGTWTHPTTYAARSRSGWVRAAPRSRPNCSDVHHGAGERPGDPGHGLDVRGHQAA
jgi:hypothetical protein